ncbi:MAG: hypothetical protein RL417_421, partial [Pseudomonadota bacterium]
MGRWSRNSLASVGIFGWFSMTSSRVDTPVSGAPVGGAPDSALTKTQPADLSSVDISRDTLKAKKSPSPSPENTQETDPSLRVIGTDLDVERARNSEAVLGLDLDKAAADRKAPAQAIAQRHEELQNAGFEDAAAPAGIPNSPRSSTLVTSGARSVQQQQEMLQGESLLLTGPKKGRTGNRDLDDFIELHPELAPLIVKIQQELAAVERAKHAGGSGLESKSSLDAALDRIATLLEGQPLAPQLRIGDRSAKEAFIELLSGGVPDRVKEAQIVFEEVQRRLNDSATVSPQPRAKLDRAGLEIFINESERIGRLQGLTLAEGSKSRAAAEASIVEARGALEKELKNRGYDTPEVRELLSATERQAAERERLLRVSETVYELQLQISIQEGRAGGAAAVEELKRYLTDQRDLLERNPGYREELAKHQLAAREEGTKLLRTCRDAAANIEEASYYTIVAGFTDEARLFQALEGRSKRELKLIGELFSENFGKNEYENVEALIRGEMEGEDLERGLKAWRGENSTSGFERRGLAGATLETIAPNSNRTAAVDAIIAGDLARSTALALKEVSQTANDPVLSMLAVIEAARVRGVAPASLRKALEEIDFEPLARLGLDPNDPTAAPASEADAIGQALVTEALSGAPIDDNKLFGYAQHRAMNHGASIGRLEALDSVPVEQLARLIALREAEARTLEGFFLRHPETREQIDSVAELARVQVRTEQINQRVAKLAHDVGVRSYNSGRDPAELKLAEVLLAAYIESKGELIGSVQGHAAGIEAIKAQSRDRGHAMMLDVVDAVNKYNVATDHWFSMMADGETAANVLRGKSSEWLVLFKEEYEKSVGEGTAVGVAHGILSGAELDRVHSLLYRDKNAATAADIEVAMSHWSGADREEYLGAVRQLKSDTDRSDVRQIFDKRYASNHYITVDRPSASGHEGVHTEIIRAKNFDEAIAYTFDGDGEIIAKAGFEGNEDLVAAASIHEASQSFFDPASKTAAELDKLRGADGAIDEERLERVEVAHEAQYKKDIRSDVDAIGGLHFNEEPGKVWAKAILDGDDIGARAAKIRSSVMGGGTERDAIREAFTMPSVLGELINQVNRGEALSAAQVEALSEGRALTRGDVRAILHAIQFANGKQSAGVPADLERGVALDEPASEELISQVRENGFLPAAVRETIASGAVTETAALAAYAEIVEAQAAHRAKVAAIDARYAKEFGGAKIKEDLKGDLGAWDLRYVETLRTSGVVPRAYRYMDACGGGFDGTEEAALRELTRGLTRAELAADRAEVRRIFSLELDSYVLSEVSGDLHFDISEDLRGLPESNEEKLAYASRRLAHEESGVFDFWAEKQHATMKTRYTDLVSAVKGGEQSDVDKAAAAFAVSSDSFRASKNATTDTIANVGATVVIVGGTVVVVTCTAGGAIPLMAVAAAGGVTRMGTKAALKGDAYGWEEGLVDGGVTVVDAAVMGITPFASLGQGVSNRVLMEGGKRIAARGGAAALTKEGAVILEEKALIQLGQGSRLWRSAASSAQGTIDGGIVAPLQTGVITALHEDTWRNGFVDGLGTIAHNGVYMIPAGMGFGGIFGGGLGLKTPKQLKLGRPMNPDKAAEATSPTRASEAPLRSDLGESLPVKTELTPRAREMLAARQESKGFITEGDTVDAELMSAALSKSKSQRVIAQAKDAAKAGRMSEGDVQALEKQLRIDGALTKFEARAVDKALNPSKFQEPISVVTQKMVDAHLKQASEIAQRLRSGLSQKGLSEVETAAIKSQISSVERRIEALQGLDKAFKQTKALADASRAGKNPLAENSSGASAVKSSEEAAAEKSIQAKREEIDRLEADARTHAGNPRHKEVIDEALDSRRLELDKLERDLAKIQGKDLGAKPLDDRSDTVISERGRKRAEELAAERKIDSTREEISRLEVDARTHADNPRFKDVIDETLAARRAELKRLERDLTVAQGKKPVEEPVAAKPLDDQADGAVSARAEARGEKLAEQRAMKDAIKAKEAEISRLEADARTHAGNPRHKDVIDETLAARRLEIKELEEKLAALQPKRAPEQTPSTSSNGARPEDGDKGGGLSLGNGSSGPAGSGSSSPSQNAQGIRTGSGRTGSESTKPSTEPQSTTPNNQAQSEAPSGAAKPDKSASQAKTATPEPEEGGIQVAQTSKSEPPSARPREQVDAESNSLPPKSKENGESVPAAKTKAEDGDPAQPEIVEPSFDTAKQINQ